MVSWPTIGFEDSLDARRVQAEDSLEQLRVSTHPCQYSVDRLAQILDTIKDAVEDHLRRQRL